jgi:cytoskeletal protein CcmA (bactofilin family)
MLRNNPGERFERPADDLSRDPLASPATRPIRDPAIPADPNGGRGNLSAGLRSDRGASVIDATSSFDGHYEAGDDLIILGTASGEIVCRGKLTIEKEANVKAKIQAHEAHVLGRLEGDIVCSGRLLLSSSATVTGTLKAAALVVEEGATIRGNVETASVASSDVLASVTRSASRRNGGEAEAAAATGTTSSSGRWNRSREAPNFAVVSSEAREENAD